jgi:hypothetical protein
MPRPDPSNREEDWDDIPRERPLPPTPQIGEREMARLTAVFAGYLAEKYPATRWVVRSGRGNGSD